jgi:hypothetical protein
MLSTTSRLSAFYAEGPVNVKSALSHYDDRKPARKLSLLNEFS